METTVDRLIDEGERLIAEQGIGVSIRSINAAAGMNPAAVHYHFGTKEGLVAAILERRMAALATERAPSLGALRALERPPLRPVVEALVAPLVRMTVVDHGNYVPFIAALRRAGEPWRSMIGTSFRPIASQLDQVLDAAAPTRSDRERAFRRRVVGIVLTEVLADARWERRTAGSTDPLTAQLVDTIVAVLER